MNNFVYEGLSTRVIFGAGSLMSLHAEVSRLGSKALVLTARAAQAEAKRLGADVAIGGGSTTGLGKAVCQSS
jgi:maleylacetate reductase